MKKSKKQKIFFNHSKIISTISNNKKLFIEIILLLIITIITIKHFVEIFPKKGNLNGDAFWTYLPNAKNFLNAPWNYLTTDPSSYYVAPLGYIWPALFNANQAYIQIANCTLFITSIFLVWISIKRLAGSLGAFITIGILIIHPDFKEHAVQVQTEAMYFFGFSLTLFGIIHGFITKSTGKSWPILTTLGLTITLLNRPVFQYILIILLIAALLVKFQKNSNQYAKKYCAIILASFILPLLVIAKNGYYFDLWSIGTGSGTGLYYGLSPNKLGAEPVFSNFVYDAHLISAGIGPNGDSNPLSKVTDEINKKVAIEIIKQTTFSDNLNFLINKFKMWLFTSTPELYVNPYIRQIRTYEWTIFLVLVLSLTAHTIVSSKELKLPGNPLINTNIKISFLILLFSILLLMAAQLSPVLYNTRYASYFIAPFTAILTGISTGYLFNSNILSEKKSISYVATSFIIIISLTTSQYITQHSLRREAWSIDTVRPGPTERWIENSSFTDITTSELDKINNLEWIATQNHSKITIYLDVEDSMLKDYAGDAIWHFRFSLKMPNEQKISSCGKVQLTVTPNQSEIHGYTPPSIIFAKTDGNIYDYMISANGASRPKEVSTISLNFNCPINSTIKMESIELRKSTMTESAISHILNNTHIDPYLNAN